MIDLHCHLLPGIDDGSNSLAMSLAMARLAVAEGITTTACTPHIYPNLFENEGSDIRRRVARLADQLHAADIPLKVTHGADIQIVPELVAGLRSGRLPTLNGSRYFLFEPPHVVVPLAFERLIDDSLAAGYVPVITHPERLGWLSEDTYGWFVNAVFEGAWIQLTADAVTGRFGKGARRWSERLLDDGLVHLLASDAHDDIHRPPRIGEGRRAAERWVGAAEAQRLVHDRPQAILDDRDPLGVAPPPALADTPEPAVGGSRLGRLMGRFFAPRTTGNRDLHRVLTMD
ncbi:CpsB/CapC family capsule biosynthesis tyrosine phosphatase [uncultured Thiodictyon sp.]|uniref:tyrosine-protein phosphatase n=1 Tax=uncultured Thiodictyon sp. TaxID=1846217 RepID=UPI0025E7E2B1|nr:CpsB/CapC family capsule biosynthesis tyrosine phosphatase [uncultured Thiodictyon sp.]